MITDIRDYYYPFEYPKFDEIAQLQTKVHWLHDEISFQSDLLNWNNELNEVDKQVVGGILKMFTQAEVLVGDYWRKVAEWFPKPEIAAMASTFSYFEVIHQRAYSLLNITLRLDDFKAFRYDEDVMSKLDYLQNNLSNSNTLEDRAKSLCIFSAFTEGVQIFSSFAILLSFRTKDLLKGIGRVVEFSIRDENLHSKGGLLLFNQICYEFPEIRENVKDDIITAAMNMYMLESKFIDSVFKEHKSITTLSKNALKEFIKNRINIKLKEAGFDSLFEINKSLLDTMSWFNALSSGQQFTDFFDTRPSDYTQTNYDANSLF